MKSLTLDSFKTVLEQSSLKSKLKNELRFITSTSHISDWSTYEYVSVTDRTADRGVLLLQPKNSIYIVPYEISRRIVDTATGRDRAITCDIC